MSINSTKKIVFFILVVLVILTFFLSAKSSIEWILLNKSYLVGDAPEDVNLASCQNIIDNISGYNIFMAGIGADNNGFSVVFILVVVGYLFTSKFAYFLKTGFGNCIITRENFGRFYKNMTIKVFLHSFSFSFICELIFLILCLLIFSFKLPTIGHLGFIDLEFYYESPFLYCLLQIINQSFFVAILSTLGYCGTIITKKTFLVTVFPLIIFVGLTIISQVLNAVVQNNLLALLYPNFIYTPFMNGVEITGSIILDVILSYAIYISLCTFGLIHMYKKYNSTYML